MRWLVCGVMGLFFAEGGWREEVREGERGDCANCKGGVVHALASLPYKVLMT